MRALTFICLILFMTSCGNVCKTKDETKIEIVDTYDLSKLPTGTVVGKHCEQDGWNNTIYYIVVQTDATTEMKKVQTA